MTFLRPCSRIRTWIWGITIVCMALGKAEGYSWRLNNAKAPPAFDKQMAYQFLLKQCSFGPRDPGSYSHQKCRDFLIDTLKKFTDHVTIQAFPLTFGKPLKKVTATNIIAQFQIEKAERILLCAHWDTRPWADKDPEVKNQNKPVPGANDGASGVAVLLEIARLVHEYKPKIGIDIVLFDGEDAGISGSEKDWAQGSAFFAKNFIQKQRPKFGILIDMIGDADLTVYKEAYSTRYARPIVEMVWRKASELNIKEFKPEVKYAVYDDHIPLLEKGVPCIDLIDFDYPYWHTLEDTPDKCSASSLEKIGNLLLHIIYSE